MANPAPVGSDVSAGTYRCTNCGYELGVQAVRSLPPCPNCSGPQDWEAIGGARQYPRPLSRELKKTGLS
jgi:lipopolysaccharide biosynthesis regulator YciM